MDIIISGFNNSDIKTSLVICQDHHEYNVPYVNHPQQKYISPPLQSINLEFLLATKFSTNVPVFVEACIIETILFLSY